MSSDTDTQQAATNQQVEIDGATLVYRRLGNAQTGAPLQHFRGNLNSCGRIRETHWPLPCARGGRGGLAIHELGGVVMVDTDELVGFEAQIKPLFREGDRDAMQAHFDLWSYDDVSEHADAILSRLAEGSMPCDGAWPQAQVNLFQRWSQDGKNP